MKTCPHCKNQLKDTAKFCGKCGNKVPDAAETPSANDAGVTCPKCGNVLKAGAKFCGKCGTRLEATPVMPTSAMPAEGKTLERVGNSGYVRWTMLPGQVAVKITEEEIEACGKVKGIAIQDGTKALFFVNGKLVAELGPGSYKFEKLHDPSTSVAPSEEPAEERRAGGFWAGLRRTCANAARAVAGLFRSVSEATSAKKKIAISVVIVRSVEFPLVFSVKDANTANLRTEVGLHILCKVTNINDFYQNLLLDRKFVSFEEMQRALNLLVSTEVNHAVAAVSPEQVANNMTLVQDLEARLRPVVAGVYPFVALVRVIQLTAEHEALESLRRMSEELYVSEQELAQLQKRNDFLNRLQSVKNEQELTEGRQGADFEAKKLEIYKQMELTKDEQSKFDLMLAAERKLREAKTEEEVTSALHEYKKSGLVREQELDQIRHQGRLADLRNTQEYDMAELKGELAQKRAQDEYDDERRDKEAAFQDARRRAEMQMDREEQQNQLDMLRQAQAIRAEREDAEPRRAMESENAARAHEEAMQQAQLNAKIENQRIYAGMSFEQIMAANPDISPEAAKALAQKFSSDSKDELLKAREADMARQNAQQMEMMKMMQQMAMAGIGATQQHQQEMINAKQAELTRTRDDANRQQDRMLAGVQSTVTAAGVAFSGTKSSSRPVRKDMDEAEAPKGRVCANCGAPLEPDASFCGECGTAV